MRQESGWLHSSFSRLPSTPWRVVAPCTPPCSQTKRRAFAGPAVGGPARAAVQLRVLPRRLWGHRAGLDVLARCAAAAARLHARSDARIGADSMEMGLSFDDAQSDPNMMRMEASAQARVGRRRSPAARHVRCCALRGADMSRLARRCATSCASMPRGATRALAPSRARRSRKAAGALA